MASDRPAASASIVPISRKLASGENAGALQPNPRTLKDVRILAVPQGGMDRLSFTTWDTIEVAGHGEDNFQL